MGFANLFVRDPNDGNTSCLSTNVYCLWKFKNKRIFGNFQETDCLDSFDLYFLPNYSINLSPEKDHIEIAKHLIKTFVVYMLFLPLRPYSLQLV